MNWRFEKEEFFQLFNDRFKQYIEKRKSHK